MAESEVGCPAGLVEMLGRVGFSAFPTVWRLLSMEHWREGSLRDVPAEHLDFLYNLGFLGAPGKAARTF